MMALRARHSEARKDARPEPLGSFSAFHFEAGIVARRPVGIGGVRGNWHDANWQMTGLNARN